MCDDIKVVLPTSFSAKGKFSSLEKSWHVSCTYIIKRRLRVYLWIQVFKEEKKGFLDKKPKHNNTNA